MKIKTTPFFNLKISRTMFCLIISFFSITISNAQALQWANAIGGASDDYGTSIATDSAGNVYTTGYFQGTFDFDPGVGIFTLTSAGGEDIYISKVDVLGSFVWAKSFGGTGQDQSKSITVDASGNVYSTGFFNGIVDFNPGSGISTLSSVGNADVYINKLDGSGNFVWAKSFGGTANDMSNSITTDASENVYTTGYWRGTTVDFDPGLGTYTLDAVAGGGDDVFVSKLDGIGNFVWAKSLGGTGDDIGCSIAVDAVGSVYTTGNFWGTCDFDPGLTTYTIASAGGSNDIFVSKLDVLGNFVWAKVMGGSLIDYSKGIAVDASGNVYTTGHFENTADFDPDTAMFNLTSLGNTDIFVSKLDAIGNFVWAKQMGGVGSDNSFSLALDASANIYTIGIFNATVDFDPGIGLFNLSAINIYPPDIFISKLNSVGNFVYALAMGGAGVDNGSAIATDILGNVYCVGNFSATADFDPSVGTLNLTSAGNKDAFWVKLNGTSTGLSEKTDLPSNSASIYPNPSKGIFQISSNESQITNIEIYNLLGEEMYTSTKPIEKKCIIDISNQPKGIYFVKIYEEEILYTQKIVIQ